MKQNSILPTRNTKNEKCFVCLMNSVLKLGLIVGLSPIHGICWHNNTNIESQFKLSKISYVIGVTVTILLTIMFSLDVNLIVTANHYMERLQLFNEIFVVITCFIMISSNTFNVKMRITELNMWKTLIEIRKQFGISTIIDLDKAKRMKRYIYIYKTALLLLMTLISVYVIKLMIDDQRYIFLCRRFASLICIYSLYVNIIQIVVQNYTMQYIFESIKAELIVCLKCNMFNNRVYTKNIKESCENKLKLLNRYYKLVMCVLKFLNSYTNIMFIMTFLQIIGTLIVNIYISITMLLTGEYYSFAAILEIETQSVIWGTIIMVTFIQKLISMVCILCGLLYLFPNSASLK